MKKRGITVLLALLVATFVTTLIAAAAAATGVKTGKPPYLVQTAPGVVVDPILSTGDIVGDYQMSGIPDGLGAYVARSAHDDDDDDDKSGGTFVVVMNHELGKSFPNQPAGVDTRISRLEIDAKSRSVIDAEYLFKGTEGFERFCSATLMLIDGRPLYFTGEEAIQPGPVHDGSSIVLDPETGAWRETAHFGHIQHENVVPMRLRKHWVFLTSEDDFRLAVPATPTTPAIPAEPSFLYAYIADNFNRALRGRSGGLYVFQADDLAKNQNSAVAKNESIPGHFIPITQAENENSTTLKAAAKTKKAFRFDRLEDIALRPDVRGRAYVADTGKPPSTARGRVYQLDVSSSDPTRATLKMILNGDASPNPDDIYNPDNMDASSKVLMIQEDRESPFRGPPGPPVADAGFNRVLAYDFRSRTLRSVARVNTPASATLRPGQWESSGIIKAFDVLGPNWWLLDVQAHAANAAGNVTPQPGPTLVPNTGSGEDGQLLALYVPGSGGGHDDDDD